MPANYNERMQKMKILQPKDKYRNKELPPQYQNHLDQTYENYLNNAVQNSPIMRISDD